jgi:hypothetical protein
MEPADHGFVLDSFRRHMLTEETPNLYAHTEAISCAVRSHVDSQWVTVALHSDPSRIVAWAGARDGNLVFAYVRGAFRRWGIGSDLVTSLIESVPISLVYWTRDAEKIRNARKYPLTWAWETFNAIEHKHRGAACS